MTLRLVALMSVVLLTSLAAFGLMMNHYQDSVMDEVAHTASEVGRATLRTLEARGSAHAGQAQVLVAETISWNDAVGPIGDGAVDSNARVIFERVGAPARVNLLGERPGGAPSAEATDVERAEFAIVCRSDGQPMTEGDCVSLADAGRRELENQFFIDIDGVRAEADPREGLVLRIETLKPESTEARPPTFVFKRHEDIRLPIPIEEYDSLFDRVRRRSLWVFLGVFALGSVLTAGLASRFTRPIRRLDAGIRRLSSGDLDVQVPTRGNDEIARLGRAFNDMTRSLRANRQRAREMLRREKHSALGRLAAGVAHDIRNPLHSIGLTLEHLKDSCRPETGERADEFERSIEIIRGEIRRLDQIVGSFLGFARNEGRPRHTVALNALLIETARLVRKEAEWRKVDVAVETDPSDPTVGADLDALRSSLLNLVLNSFEAMPDGGRLRLSIDSSEERVAIEVVDDGPGVPAEDQDRVFDFDYTTKDGGNGLGLAMVYQCIVEDHGGQVTLDSPPDGGTRVRMTLPRVSAGRAEPRA
ncbi:MAG TPA: HAMP domain-containing sensor histidine kinase [Candidatus Polarisedimenticolaceae bacterium]|nr:HAMP domain-containing sensor histidine kinase [Candidatus Polarisedimenticolaceae bacterium]